MKDVPHSGFDGMTLSADKLYTFELISDEVEENEIELQDGTPLTRYIIDVKYKGEDTKISLPNSVIGRIVDQADKLGKQLKGLRFSLIKHGEGKDTRYDVTVQD